MKSSSSVSLINHRRHSNSNSRFTTSSSTNNSMFHTNHNGSSKFSRDQHNLTSNYSSICLGCRRDQGR